MRFQSSIVAIALITLFLPALCLGFVENPAVKSGTYASVSPAPESNLSSAYRIAKRGDIERGLTLAKSTLETCPNDVEVKLSFMETMIRIHKLGPTKHETRLINCAIETANNVYKTAQCNGDGDPRYGFKYMRALSQLAGIVRPQREDVSVQLKAVAGDIAGELLDNKKLSPKSHKYLAQPLYDKALVLWQKQERELAANALKVSFEAGFSEVAKAKSDFNYEFLAATDIIRTTIESAVDSMVASEIKKARKLMLEFNSFAYNIDVDGLESGRLTSAQFAGKPMVVDLWATWCPPCRKSTPHFVRLREEYKKSDLTVLAISLDDMDNPLGTRETVKAAAEEHHFNYPCGLGSYSVINQIGGELQLPTTLFIDSNGNVRYVAQGYMEFVKLNALTKALMEFE